MFLVDGHLDLAENALNWYRDLELSVAELRRAEAGVEGKGRGCAVVTLPEMRRGEIGLSFATIVDRIGKAAAGAPAGVGSPTLDVCYAKGQAQLAYYRILETRGLLRIIRDRAMLEAHLAAWDQDPGGQPLGIILNIEGADPVAWPQQVGEWWEGGVRIIALAYNQPNLYADGTGGSQGLTQDGRTLLRLMEQTGVILDLSHLAEPSFWEALDVYGGPVLASHNNCRALVPGARQFTDEQIHAIVARDGVIGAAFDAWMLSPGYVRGVTPRETVSLENVVDHICHICDLAGDARHVAIGSDLDGGYGNEQTPWDLDTIADLQKLADLLLRRGFEEADVGRVLHGNWIDLLRRAWR